MRNHRPQGLQGLPGVSLGPGFEPLVGGHLERRGAGRGRPRLHP